MYHLVSPTEREFSSASSDGPPVPPWDALSSSSTDCTLREQYNPFLPTSISSIPVELLSEIFLWATKPRLVTFDEGSAPLNISHTCRLWRQLAIGMRRLWNVIHIDYFKYSAEILWLWMEHANGLPLFLHVTRTGILNPEDDIDRIVNIFVRRGTWWGNMQLLGLAVPRYTSLRLISERSPIRNLQCCVWVLGPEDSPTQSFQYFWAVACYSPLLRDITLGIVPTSAPWSQLLRLALTQTRFEPGIDALSQCANLTSLNWELHPDANEESQLPTLTIPRLVRLSVRAESISNARSLFKALTLPHLARLDLRFRYMYRFVTDELTEMLLRSGIQLRHFSLLQDLSLPGPSSIIDHDRLLRGDATIRDILQSSCFRELRGLSFPSVTRVNPLCAFLSSPANLPMLQELDVGVKGVRLPMSLIHALQNRSADSDSNSSSQNRITYVSLHQQGERLVPQETYPFKPETLPNIEVCIKPYDFTEFMS